MFSDAETSRFACAVTALKAQPQATPSAKDFRIRFTIIPFVQTFILKLKEGHAIPQKLECAKRPNYERRNSFCRGSVPVAVSCNLQSMVNGSLQFAPGAR